MNEAIPRREPCLPPPLPRHCLVEDPHHLCTNHATTAPKRPTGERARTLASLTPTPRRSKHRTPATVAASTTPRELPPTGDRNRLPCRRGPPGKRLPTQIPGRTRHNSGREAALRQTQTTPAGSSERVPERRDERSVATASTSQPSTARRPTLASRAPAHRSVYLCGETPRSQSRTTFARSRS
jgi:hypothetical protein